MNVNAKISIEIQGVWQELFALNMPREHVPMVYEHVARKERAGEQVELIPTQITVGPDDPSVGVEADPVEIQGQLDAAW